MIFKNFATKVRVLVQRDNKPAEVVKTGIVVQQNTGIDSAGFVRVFDNRKVKDGGDTNAANAEKFPINSARCWVEIVGELINPLTPVPELM